MSAHCCSAPVVPTVDPKYRRALWIALVVNAGMFLVELVSSWSAGSVSLLADSIDFFGDATNYALSLAVLGLALSVRSKAAMFKAACMGAFGVFVLVLIRTTWICDDAYINFRTIDNFLHGYGLRWNIAERVQSIVLGALILEPGQQYLTLQVSNSYASELIWGSLFLLVILFLPRGVVPMAGEKAMAWRARRERRRAGQPAAARPASAGTADAALPGPAGASTPGGRSTR